MIYETIPMYYFDHTDLVKAIVEANVISAYAKDFANKATEHLMDDNITSGIAFKMGETINMLKNVEHIVDHWVEILKFTAFELNWCADQDYFEISEHHRKNYDIKVATELDNKSLTIPDVIGDFYREWEQHLNPLARKYNITTTTNMVNIRKNGIAERLFYESAIL